MAASGWLILGMIAVGTGQGAQPGLGDLAGDTDVRPATAALEDNLPIAQMPSDIKKATGRDVQRALPTWSEGGEGPAAVPVPVLNPAAAPFPFLNHSPFPAGSVSEGFKAEPAPPPVQATPTIEPQGPTKESLGILPPYMKADQQPPALRRPLEPPAPPSPAPKFDQAPALFLQPFDVPLGFTGPSGILPRDVQTDPHFVPVEDRWRIGFPNWDRYVEPLGPDGDAPYQVGHWWDPFNLNVLKGDYPIFGQNTFFVLTATSETLVEPRQVPIATTVLESTARPGESDFFGRPNQAVFNQFFSLGLELFHGDAAFKPVDWRVKVTPVFNINYLNLDEVGITNPDVRHGEDRARTYISLEEWFAEAKLADLSPNYDFLSVRVGSQPFNSDFRGFIFNDTNRAIRLFGNLDSNRVQFNLIYLDQLEKDTNSGLNTFENRNQQILIGNVFVQDFIFPGYTSEWSVHYNHDEPTFRYDTNGFLVRPDPAGAFTPHGLDVAYLGWTGDGHINQFNVDNAFYWALGRDSLNPIANQGQDISAFMAALELSYDRDWMRFRVSGLFASGDQNPNNGHATGFDSIQGTPNFAGSEFSYLGTQSIGLLGVNLFNRNGLFPDLRSSLIQGQSNFVNPGLILLNTGVDFDLTPKLRLITNVNFNWFDNVESLQTFTFQQHIASFIGIDLSAGIEYRPLLSNNVIIKASVASLLPGEGFRDLYNNPGTAVNPLFAGSVDLVLRY